MDRVFFTSGGSESVEAAWKLAREHFLAIGQPQRTKAIARDIAYHGVTLGALSFTGVRALQGAVRPRRAIDVTHVSNTNVFRAPRRPDDPEAFCTRLLTEVEDAILAAGPDEVALIIAEPVQNAGGCLVAAARLLGGPARAGRQVRRAADGRRGHLRLRPHGRVDRHQPRRDRARLGVLGQGVDVGLRGDGGGGRRRARRRADRRARRGLPPRHHLRRAPGRRGDRAQEHGDLRARRRARERARP